MPRSPFNRAVAEIVLIFSSLFHQMVDGSVSVLRSLSLHRTIFQKKNLLPDGVVWAVKYLGLGNRVSTAISPRSPEVGTDCTCTFGRAYLGPLRACLDWCPAKILAS